MSCDAERACGHRKENGVYFTLSVGPNGTPLEEFLIDVPIELPEGLDLAAQGVAVIERNGVTHLVDRIGSDNYPNICDFIEEVRRKGLSRRLQSTLDFSKLTPESRLICVHDRALIGNARDIPIWHCPRRKAPHTHENTPLCLGACWGDIQGGEPFEQAFIARQAPADSPTGLALVDRSPAVSTVLRVRRTLKGGTTYEGYARPEGFTPRYRAAFFAAFPASAIEVVRGNQSAQRMAQVSKSTVPYREVDR